MNNKFLIQEEGHKSYCRYSHTAHPLKWNQFSGGDAVHREGIRQPSIPSGTETLRGGSFEPFAKVRFSGEQPEDACCVYVCVDVCISNLRAIASNRQLLIRKVAPGGKLQISANSGIH